jgi:ankyrin repeat protein
MASLQRRYRRPVDDDRALLAVFRAIAGGDSASTKRLLADDPGLATASLPTGATRTNPSDFFLTAIGHYVYRGDTAIHVAGAAYDAPLVDDLVGSGAAVNAVNRRGATPLHYAVDGGPNAARWRPDAQVGTIERLVLHGADVHMTDKSGTAPLHRAVRNRCAGAVLALLEAGADPHTPNAKGSTPLQLASWATGRSGAGTPEAKAQQALILEYLGEAPNR